MAVKIAGVLKSRPDDVVRYIVMDTKGRVPRIKSYKSAENADFWNHGADIYEVKVPA